MKISNLLLALLFCLPNSLAAQDPVYLESVRVKENKFVSASGKEMIFHGVSIRDPHELEKAGEWNKAHFKMAREWGADLVRLPVHPSAWRERGSENYIELIDQAVEWAGSLGMYIIIDWHSIGNLYEEKFQNPMYNTTLEETHEFWQTISAHFEGEPVIAMYELFNEPTISGPRFGTMTWDQWKRMNEEMISLIRRNDREIVILVAGFNWAYDLTPVKDAPVERKNIAYVSHPYPQKRDMPWEPQWEDDWGYVAAKYPVILTEIGFALPDEPGVHIPVIGDEFYGEKLVDFCAERGISWVAWCFDNKWSPYMYTGDYVPTRQGKFFKKVMMK